MSAALNVAAEQVHRQCCHPPLARCTAEGGGGGSVVIPGSVWRNNVWCDVCNVLYGVESVFCIIFYV